MSKEETVRTRNALIEVYQGFVDKHKVSQNIADTSDEFIKVLLFRGATRDMLLVKQLIEEFNSLPQIN